ncbi:glycosyltransferase family 2 protein [Arsenicicoccus cauae]|uniref:glycosyltransferase family 2 protein n=1 Tax=Arsenicicoccus cauae TaxID=2663847 RepID=UPI0025999BCB|nr:glycosyltransferase [uncultured Arsenicicoccus sp.]
MPARQPLVSVIIPAYQAEAYLGAAVTSALTQTYPNIEVVITNDGSNDRTGAIAAAYGDLVRVVTQENRGLPGARNSAIREARGELVALLDADDILLPPYVQTAVDSWLADGDERTFVTCDAHLMSGAGIVQGRTVLPSGTPAAAEQRRRILENNFVSVFSVFPRRMWEEIGGFDESMRVCEDYDFWARAIYAGWTARFVTAHHALYRRAAGSLSTQSERMYAGEQQVLAHVAELHGASLSTEERRFLDLRLERGSAVQQVDLGESALRRGDVPTAAEHFAVASQLMPSARRIRLKAEVLRRAPALGAVYARRLAAKDRETGRTYEDVRP